MLMHFDSTNDQRIRYASAIAAQCGIRVSIEVARCLHEDGQPELPCHVWRGTAEQFRRLWFITAGDSNFEGIKKMRWLCPGWLRGHLYREGIDSYRFVIESGYGLTRQMQKRILRQAAGDAGFQRFMARLRTPINTD